MSALTPEDDACVGLGVTTQGTRMSALPDLPGASAFIAALAGLRVRF
jgi:hypothetical protein